MYQVLSFSLPVRASLVFGLNSKKFLCVFIEDLILGFLAECVGFYDLCVLAPSECGGMPAFCASRDMVFSAILSGKICV